jgi:hypothetical protein
MSEILGGAILSARGNYRYQLWRRWSAGPELLWILLNPSTADAEHDDATIRKCIGFSRRWDYGGLRVINLFAYRATAPADLLAASDPVGPENDAVIRSLRTRECIVAWGNHGDFHDRAVQVLKMLRRPVFCVGITASGQPKHPVRLSYSTPRQVYSPRCES